MDLGTAATILGTLTIAAVTGYSIYNRKLQHEEIGKVVPGTEKAREHERAMADKGYVQIPVPHRHSTSAIDNSDSDTNDERVTDEKVWQLAWVHKDAAADILSVTETEVSGDLDLLEEALRPT